MWSHIFVGKWVCSLVNNGLFTGVKVFALHSSTSLIRYTKKLFRTNSWLTLCFILSQKGIAKFSSLPIAARFSPKSTCTVDTTIYQTQARMFFKAHSLGIWTTTNFQKRSESKHLGPYSYMINTVSDGFNTLSKVLFSALALGWIEVRYSTRRSTSRRCSNMLKIV